MSAVREVICELFIPHRPRALTLRAFEVRVIWSLCASAGVSNKELTVVTHATDNNEGFRTRLRLSCGVETTSMADKLQKLVSDEDSVLRLNPSISDLFKGAVLECTPVKWSPVSPVDKKLDSVVVLVPQKSSPIAVAHKPSPSATPNQPDLIPAHVYTDSTTQTLPAPPAAPVFEDSATATDVPELTVKKSTPLNISESVTKAPANKRALSKRALNTARAEAVNEAKQRLRDKLAIYKAPPLSVETPSHPIPRPSYREIRSSRLRRSSSFFSAPSDGTHSDKGESN